MRKPHVLSLSVQNLAHFPQLPSRGKIQRWISRALENDAQITVRFVEEEEGRELNKTYRGKDYATNVLTLHAQGYDHMDDEEAEVMEQRETDVLVDLGFDVPYPDRNYTPQPLA